MRIWGFDTFRSMISEHFDIDVSFIDPNSRMEDLGVTEEDFIEFLSLNRESMANEFVLRPCDDIKLECEIDKYRDLSYIYNVCFTM